MLAHSNVALRPESRDIRSANLARLLRPVAGYVHGVVQHTQDIDPIFRLVHDIQDEVTRGPAALRDVKKPPVGRQPVAMVAAPRVLPDALAGFGDQSTVFLYLKRPELGARRPKKPRVCRLSLCR
jgi:hypothetical protein